MFTDTETYLISELWSFGAFELCGGLNHEDLFSRPPSPPPAPHCAPAAPLTQVSPCECRVVHRLTRILCGACLFSRRLALTSHLTRLIPSSAPALCPPPACLRLPPPTCCSLSDARPHAGQVPDEALSGLSTARPHPHPVPVKAEAAVRGVREARPRALEVSGPH